MADADAVARYETTAARGSGRTLDRATAWGLLWELSALDVAWLGASTRARVRRRIRESDAPTIAAAVTKRSRARRYAAANAERAASDLFVTGRAVAHLIGTDLIEDRRQVHGYVRSGTVEAYAKSHFMIPAADGRHTLYESTLPVAYGAVAMPAVVIAPDLAGSVDTREPSAGLQSLEAMRQQWLADYGALIWRWPGLAHGRRTRRDRDINGMDACRRSHGRRSPPCV